EGMHIDQRARAFAVDVEVTHVEIPFRALDPPTFPRIESAGQTVNRVVGDRERVVDVFGFDQGEDRAEDLLLGDAGLRGDVRDYGGLDEPPLVGQLVPVAADNDAAFLPADFNVPTDFFEGALARHRARVIVQVLHRAYR